MARRGGLWAEVGLNLAALTVAVLVLDVGVFFLVTRQVLQDAAVDLAERSAVVVAGQLAATPPADWRRVVEAHRRGGGADLTVYDADGEVIAGAARPGSRAVSAAFLTRELQVDPSTTPARVVAPVGAPGRPTAAVAVGAPVDVVSRPAWTVVVAHAVLSASLIAWMGLALLRRGVIRPLSEMQQAARRIEAGEFGVVLSEDHAEELAALARALNRMSVALAGYRTRTADQLARLEAANLELREAQEALVRSEKLASVGRLAAGLAHELGNPLTAVRGYTEILAEGVDPALQEELVRRARTEVERMHGLLRGLLDYAREEPPQIAPVDLGALVGEAAATVRHLPAFRGVTLEVAADGAPSIDGDAARLHQVLVNLLLNAAEAGAHTIRLRAAGGPGGPVVEVADDGEGIPPEHLPRIYEPFFTTRPPGRGTGLGLAIAQRIVDQHGGRIEVHSVPGRGTTFRLRWDAPPLAAG